MELTFKRLENVNDLDALRLKLKKEHQESDAHRLRVCCGTACQATGSLKLIDQFEKEAARKQEKLEIVKTGCQGFCQRGPVVIQDPQEIFYQKVKVADVPSLFSDSVLHGVPYRKTALPRVSLVRSERDGAATFPFIRSRNAWRSTGTVSLTPAIFTTLSARTDMRASPRR